MKDGSTAEDMTFEMALARLSERMLARELSSTVLSMSRAIGLAYGMSTNDVFECARIDAAITDQRYRDEWLSYYPQWCRGKGADYNET